VGSAIPGIYSVFKARLTDQNTHVVPFLLKLVLTSEACCAEKFGAARAVFKPVKLGRL
jgi:hypothetical protein